MCACWGVCDFMECFTTTFLRAHSWLNWVECWGGGGSDNASPSEFDTHTFRFCSLQSNIGSCMILPRGYSTILRLNAHPAINWKANFASTHRINTSNEATCRSLIDYINTPWNVCAVRYFVRRGVVRKFGGSTYLFWPNYNNQAVICKHKRLYISYRAQKGWI